MEHDEATRSHAAERYVKRELSPAQRDAFEEHFFDCRKCADDVRFELTFAANVQAVSREQRAAPRTAVWERWRDRLRMRPAMAFSFAANFILAAGFGYVLLTVSRQSPAPGFVQPYFAPGPTKGAADVHAIPAGEALYSVTFPNGLDQSYSYEILSAAGRREVSGTAKAPAGNDAYFQVPIRGLPEGIHTLVVSGTSGEIVSWSRFHIAR
ncbi:MAG TPA: zf-HC2 domain-containing protein [Bryobacteraceae bacterium]|nr:zf-HC2 domain-containing protein [Bryobacteraceae bacterium]